MCLGYKSEYDSLKISLWPLKFYFRGAVTLEWNWHVRTLIWFPGHAPRNPRENLGHSIIYPRFCLYLQTKAEDGDTKSDGKPHQCGICGFQCDRISKLQEHMRKHTGEKPFQCEVCDKFCSRKSNLKEHMRVHTGERPFLCKYCGKRFTVLANAKQHEVAHIVVKYVE
jgi:uncharacterized Zn-finger protein